MFATILIAILAAIPCNGQAIFEEQYYNKYVPETVERFYGLQVKAPNTAYIAASGRNKLYFIDKRFDEATAWHIKQQIERASIPKEDEIIFIDEVKATAEIRKIGTNETVFVFDPPYARVIFARGMNKHNPTLNLPEHEPPGSWEVNYNLEDRLTTRVFDCNDYLDCTSDADCIRRSNGNCGLCHSYLLSDDCDQHMTNAIGICIRICSKAEDTPRYAGEGDANYYQRMDTQNWGY